MNILFIQSIAAGDWEEFKLKCIPFIVCITCDTIAMFIDLIAGIRKANQRGEICTSYGYRRTIDKALKYYSLLLLCFMVDIIASLVVSVPYFTMAAGIGIILIEIKSWYEKTDEKDRSDINMIASILKNKDDIIKEAAKLMYNEIKDSNDTEGNKK